MVYGFSLANSV